MIRERVALLLLSAALIGFQLAIIQILSYSQWHHFAYLAVSIAMLGFGSSGVILALYAKPLIRAWAGVIPWLIAGSGLLMVISPMAIGLQPLRFDSFLLFASGMQILRLLLTCLVLFIPFLLGAMVIGLYFMVRAHSIPLLYAWNLAGSALGGIALILLSYALLPMDMASVFGILALAAGCLASPRPAGRWVSALLMGLGILVVAVQGQLPYTSEYKALSRTLLMPQTEVVRTQPLPQGVFQLVRSQSLRQAEGLSLTYTGAIPLADMVFLNAHAYCALERLPVDTAFYNQNIFALPFYLTTPGTTLILEPKSTFFVSQALHFGSPRITVAEPLTPLADTLRLFPWAAPGVEVHARYPREFLSSTGGQWQHIVFPIVGSFGGSAGLGAMQEQYLLTQEALRMAMSRLQPRGMLALSAYMDTPPRYSLKLLTLSQSVLMGMGLDPAQHILALRSWNILLVLLKPEPFTHTQRGAAQHFASARGFDLVMPPSAVSINQLPDTTFQRVVGSIFSDGPTDCLALYPFNLTPPTDDSPYFAQFIRLTHLSYYLEWFGLSQLPFLELGYLVVWASLAVCLLLALGVIAIPMARHVGRSPFLLSLWAFFAFIGLGYMLVEIALIQRTILTLGNPITASAAIISAILCFSAVGSYFSARFPITPMLFIALAGIALLVVALALTSGWLSEWLLGLPSLWRVVVLLLYIAPLAIPMGMVFPTAMRLIAERCPQQIPIAWGVNGFFSVLAAPLGTILAVEEGFTGVFLLSALLYAACIPMGLLFLRRKAVAG